jgi:hypothetical protein
MEDSYESYNFVMKTDYIGKDAAAAHVASPSFIKIYKQKQHTVKRKKASFSFPFFLSFVTNQVT